MRFLAPVVVVADPSSPDDVASAVAETVARYGGLDVAVNAAGVLRSTRIDEITPDEGAFPTRREV